MIRFSFLPLFILLFSLPSFGQLTQEEEQLLRPSLNLKANDDYLLNLSLKGLGSTGTELPFWLHHNQRGRLSADSNIMTLVAGKHIILLPQNAFLISGAGLFYRDGADENVDLDELYLHFQNSWFYATAGRKQQREIYNGLSASNRSLLWSLNAQPLPGIQLGFTEPLFPFSREKEGLGFTGSWNEYLMEEDRHVSNAKVHHKNFLLVFRKGTWEVSGGLQHIAQWGGTSPRHGEQPQGFTDYLRIISGRGGGENAALGDQQNALGNHFGGWEFFIKKEFRNFYFTAAYNHIFEDGSGLKFRNTPDGRYTFFVEAKEKEQLVNSFIYELYYMHHHSHTFPNVEGPENYFWNGMYRSGWTYQRRIIGAPFFTTGPDGQTIINDKYAAHHFGIGGDLGNPYFQSYPYKILLSYAHNDGLYRRRYRPQQDVLYLLTELSLIKSSFDLNFQFGAEFDSYKSPVYGAGVNLRYKVF